MYRRTSPYWGLPNWPYFGLRDRREMFWTLDDTDGFPPVTFCEEHALDATNYAMKLVGDKPFGSMAEAYVVLSASTALAGYDFGMTSSETGECDECKEMVEHDCS